MQCIKLIEIMLLSLCKEHAAFRPVLLISHALKSTDEENNKPKRIVHACEGRDDAEARQKQRARRHYEVAAVHSHTSLHVKGFRAVAEQMVFLPVLFVYVSFLREHLLS